MKKKVLLSACSSTYGRCHVSDVPVAESESRRWLKQCDFTYSGCCRQNDSYHYN